MDEVNENGSRSFLQSSFEGGLLAGIVVTLLLGTPIAFWLHLMSEENSNKRDEDNKKQIANLQRSVEVLEAQRRESTSPLPALCDASYLRRVFGNCYIDDVFGDHDEIVCPSENDTSKPGGG